MLVGYLRHLLEASAPSWYAPVPPISISSLANPALVLLPCGILHPLGQMEVVLYTPRVRYVVSAITAAQV